MAIVIWWDSVAIIIFCICGEVESPSDLNHDIYFRSKEETMVESEGRGQFSNMVGQSSHHYFL